MQKLLLCLQTICCLPSMEHEAPQNVQAPTIQLAEPHEELIDLSTEYHLIQNTEKQAPDWLVKCTEHKNNGEVVTFAKDEIVLYNLLETWRFAQFKGETTTPGPTGAISGYLLQLKKNENTFEVLKKNVIKIEPVIPDEDQYNHTAHLILNQKVNYQPESEDDNPYKHFHSTAWANPKLKKFNELREDKYFFEEFKFYVIDSEHYSLEFFNNEHEIAIHHEWYYLMGYPTQKLALKKIDGLLFTQDTKSTLAFPDLLYQDTETNSFYMFDFDTLLKLPAHPNLQAITIKKQFLSTTLFTPKKETGHKIATNKLGADARITFN